MFRFFVIVLLLVYFSGLQCARVEHSQDADEAKEMQAPASAVPGSSGSSPEMTGTLSDEVREIIRPMCGSCHTSTLPTAKTGAVKIFDLVKDDWPQTMSLHHLDKFSSRLGSLTGPGKETVRFFVELEQAKRTQ